MMKGIIVASGYLNLEGRSLQLIQEEIKNADLVISADGGARYLSALSLVPDYIVGDFDSIHRLEDVTKTYPDAVVLEYPVKKDATDSEIAFDLAMEKGADEIVMIGGTGSRLDHSLANVFMLKSARDRGVDARIVDGHNVIRYVENDVVTLYGSVGDYISIIPIGERLSGVVTKGLEYIVAGGIIEFGSSYGVSNVLSETSATIEIQQGKALVIQSFD